MKYETEVMLGGTVIFCIGVILIGMVVFLDIILGGVS